MTALIYNFKDIQGHSSSLELRQSDQDELWCIVEGSVTLARISRIHDSWKQLSGEALPREMVRSAGAYIEKHYYDSIPLQIRDKWPSIIGRAEKKSESEISIVCKPQVNLNTFRSIFCKHVPKIFNQEITVNLKVYSYNFAQDFSYKLEVKNRR